ncbi:glycoside hydrolase [Halosquirtibacter xylanolyticus]|uniref:sialidase family protein n=1 Tax=Halosquirtibacter xylanolyticus TaxID=3374599 RepID=UPI0037493ACF|nr:glycoside hydrolase [Prolixibacteraceae bacterium]
MRNSLFVMTILLFVCHQLKAQTSTTVFYSGEEGYHSYRIPAIIKTQDGDLLAFAEGRKNRRGDVGDIDLVYKRSTNNGQSWSKMKVIVDNNDGVAGNPSPVVIDKNGKIVLLFVIQAVNTHQKAIRQGIPPKGGRTPYIIISEDHGKQWSKPRSLEKSCDKKIWGWYATGPGHGIEIKKGKYKGRIVIPANHNLITTTQKDPINPGFSAHLIYSDDQGDTWKIGAIDEESSKSRYMNPNETMLTELANGDLYINSRNCLGATVCKRADAWSCDGGEHFTTKSFTPNLYLQTPNCQGSIISYGDTIIFSGPYELNRKDLTLWASYDKGHHWTKKKCIHKGNAAYSDLVKISSTELGVLYESKDIKFKKILLSEIDL